MSSSVRQVAILGLYLSILFSLYLVPLGMYSPCIKEAGMLGPPPSLIGHRGAPMVRLCSQIHRNCHLVLQGFSSGSCEHGMSLCVCLQLAPENTVMSFKRTVEAGGEGLETDVTIRYERLSVVCVWCVFVYV